MWCGKQILHMKNNEIYALKEKIASLHMDLRAARDDLEATKKAYTNEARMAPVVIDWDNFEVFSVERMHMRDGKECLPYTVLGYWKNVNDNGVMVRKTGEWIYQINDVNHRMLVEQFKAHLEKKAKKNAR